MLDFLILYSSITGNTKKIATSIFNAIPGTSKELCDIKNFHYDKEANVYFVGFWTNRGSCDMNILTLLSSLHNKKIALFGTCGMGQNPIYFHSIANNVSAFIAEDCEYLGSYFCQGKMPHSILEKYEMLKKKNPEESSSIDKMIENYNEALSHPNDQDFTEAQNFTNNILSAVI